MSNETTELAVVEVDPGKYDLDTTKAHEIDLAFEPLALQRKALLDEFQAIIEAPITEEVCKQAGDLRRKLVKVRTGFAAIHKTQKHLFRMAGLFVDAIKNANTEPVSQMESRLADVEKHFVNLENERIAQLGQDRAAKLTALGVETLPTSLGQMPDDVWEACLAGFEVADQKRKEAARDAEEQRVAAEQKALQDAADAEAERVRQAEENKRLQEQAKKDADAIRVAEEQAAKEREAHNAKVRAIEEKAAQEKADADAKLKAEKDARDKADRERRDAELQRQVDEKNAAAKKEQEERKEAAIAASQENIGTKNAETVNCLVGLGLTEKYAAGLVNEIANGNVVNVSMNY